MTYTFIAGRTLFVLSKWQSIAHGASDRQGGTSCAPALSIPDPSSGKQGCRALLWEESSSPACEILCSVADVTFWRVGMCCVTAWTTSVLTSDSYLQAWEWDKVVFINLSPWLLTSSALSLIFQSASFFTLAKDAKLLNPTSLLHSARPCRVALYPYVDELILWHGRAKKLPQPLLSSSFCS